MRATCPTDQLGVDSRISGGARLRGFQRGKLLPGNQCAIPPLHIPGKSGVRSLPCSPLKPTTTQRIAIHKDPGRFHPVMSSAQHPFVATYTLSPIDELQSTALGNGKAQVYAGTKTSGSPFEPSHLYADGSASPSSSRFTSFRRPTSSGQQSAISPGTDPTARGFATPHPVIRTSVPQIPGALSGSFSSAASVSGGGSFSSVHSPFSAVDLNATSRPVTSDGQNPPPPMADPNGSRTGYGSRPQSMENAQRPLAPGTSFGAASSGMQYPPGTSVQGMYLPMSAGLTMDPRTAMTSDFAYDADAALPPISQDFTRPNIDESKRPATSAGIMLRDFNSGGYGGGFGSAPMYNDGSTQSAMPGIPQGWQQQGPGESAGPPEDDLHGVFSHTVDVNGVSVLGGPTFQDPFALAHSAPQTIEQGIEPDRIMTAGSSVNLGVDQIDLGSTQQPGVPGPSFARLQPPAFQSSQFNPMTFGDVTYSNPSRRASEPHFKINSQNVSLPSHAALYQTLGLANVNAQQQQAMSVAALAARRGSKDISDMNPNQLRHLIAQRRGSVDTTRPQMTPQERSMSIGSIPEGEGSISPAQMQWRSSLAYASQRRPVSHGGIAQAGQPFDDRYAAPSGARTVPGSITDPYTSPNGPVQASRAPPSLSGYSASPGGYVSTARHSDPAVGAPPGTFGSFDSGRHMPARGMPSVFGSYPAPMPHGSPTDLSVRRHSDAPAARRDSETLTTLSSGGQHTQFSSHIGPTPKKRPRRKFDQIERLYLCGFEGCEKSYGTLNHLNAHVSMQKHGIKRRPEGGSSRSWTRL